MDVTGESTAKAVDQPHNVHALLPWQVPRYARRAAVVLVWVLVLAACFLSGFGSGRASSQRYLTTLYSTDDYFLPVDSHQLTVAIVPLDPGPLARESLGESDSRTAASAGQLVNAACLVDLANNLAELYPLHYRVARSLTIPDEFFNPDRRQYRADQVLNWLVTQANPHDFRSVGVLSSDLYKPGYNFLFGVAKTGGSSCISSSARMGGGPERAQLSPEQRWHSIVRHELGHTLGLAHNETGRSVMVYGNSLAELDQQAVTLTSAEWRRLEQIHPIIWRR